MNASFCQPSVENGTIPASSHTSPTSGMLEERWPHRQCRILAILEHAGLAELVLRERRAAARAPLRRAVAADEPPAIVHDLEEPPDVLDVGVAERVVVALPVHPLPESLGRPPELPGRPGDDLAAFGGELVEAVLLDLLLGVHAERLLDGDLDPQALAVPAVLVALVVAAQGLVAQEYVLERPPPGGVHAHRLVRRHGAVEEAEPRPFGVLLAQPLEHALALPVLEDLLLEGGELGHRGESREGLRHGRDGTKRPRHLLSVMRPDISPGALILKQWTSGSGAK